MRTGAQSAQLSVIAKSSLRHRLGGSLSKNNQDSSRTDESVHGSFPQRFLLVKSVRRVIVCSSFYFLTRWLLRLKNHHFAILKRPISVIIAGIGQRTRNANFALPVDNRYTGKLTAWSHLSGTTRCQWGPDNCSPVQLGSMLGWDGRWLP